MTDLKEISIQEIIDMNFRLNALLGYATALVYELKSYKQLTNADAYDCDWFLKAIENVVYLKKGFPEFL